MVSKIESVSSTTQLSSLGSKNTIVVIDFHATWCGPCKAIAPVFESLSQKFGSPGKVLFVKCDVDEASQVVQQYRVTAMPTFIVLKKGAEADRIQGADRDKLTASVERFARDAKSTVTQGKGYTLGGSSSGRSAAPPAFVRDGVVTNSLPAGHRITGFIDTCVMFLGLYIVSLFSLDAMAAAEASGFGVSGATRNRGVGGIGPSGRRLGTVQGLH